MGRRARVVLIAGLAVLGGGCSWRNGYEAGLEIQRQQCYKNANPADVQRCLERVNGQTYDDYRKAREGSRDEVQ